MILKLFPFLLGIISVAFQVVLLRLTFVLFYGNELASGIFLSFWLMWSSIGSLLANFVNKRIKDKYKIFNSLLVLLSILFFLTYLIGILLRKALSPFLGEILGLGQIIYFCIIILSGVCLGLGFSYGLSCYIYPNEQKSKKIGFSYLLESIGSGIGGIIFGFFILQKIGILNLCFLLSILICIYSISFNLKRKKILLFNIFILIVYLFFLTFSFNINKSLFSLLLPGYKLLELRDTKYSNIQVVERFNQISFLENGILDFSLPQRLEAETIHIILSQAPFFRRVLLIGSQGGELIKEILKYAPQRIDVIELDPEKIKLINKYSQTKNYYYDKRVKVFIGDGVNYIKTTHAKYDCIILNLSDPLSLSLNRFYTQEFFKETKRILNTPGIIGFRLSSQENYINKELGKYLRVMKNTLETVFKEVVVYPGQYAIFIGSNIEGVLAQDYKEVIDKIKKKRIKLKYLNEAYLSQRLSKERLKYLKETLAKTGVNLINRDFYPICFWLDIVYFSQHFRDIFRGIFKILNKDFLFKLFVFLSLGIFVISLFFNKKNLILLSLSVTGFSEISFQIITFLFFQILYGYLYYMIGALFGSYMVGLFIGSLAFLKKKFKDLYSSYLKMQTVITLYPLVLIGVVFLFKNFSFSLKAEKVIFLFLPFIAGFLGAAQYILANKIFITQYQNSEFWGPLTYGFDLLGSAVGALGVSIFFIPICGLLQTSFLLFFLNILIVVSLLKIK